MKPSFKAKNYFSLKIYISIINTEDELYVSIFDTSWASVYYFMSNKFAVLEKILETEREKTISPAVTSTVRAWWRCCVHSFCFPLECSWPPAPAEHRGLLKATRTYETVEEEHEGKAKMLLPSWKSSDPWHLYGGQRERTPASCSNSHVHVHLHVRTHTHT